MSPKNMEEEEKMSTVCFIENMHSDLTYSADACFDEDDVESLLDVIDAEVERALSILDTPEQLVMRLVLRGFKRKEICLQLGISSNTVDKIMRMYSSILAKHLSQVFQKEIHPRIVYCYFIEIKKYKHRINLEWNLWMGYRERTEQETEEKMKKALLNEIERKSKEGKHGRGGDEEK